MGEEEVAKMKICLYHVSRSGPEVQTNRTVNRSDKGLGDGKENQAGFQSESGKR
jgi:hypothetical protein